MRVTTSSLLWLVGNSNAVNPCPPLPGTDGSDWCQTEFRSAVGISSKSFIKVHHLPLHLILLVTKFRLETDENSCLFFCKTVILHLEFSMCLLMLLCLQSSGRWWPLSCMCTEHTDTCATWPGTAGEGVTWRNVRWKTNKCFVS